MAYLFTDWQEGRVPPKGWDCADAIADGWSKAEIDAVMRATVRFRTPEDKLAGAKKEKPAAREPEPEKPIEQLRLAGKPRLAQEARTVEQLKPEPDGNIAHITGTVRFDLELESWLNAKQWAIRRNLLSDSLEVHRPNDIVPLTDERLSEIRFTFTYASNGKEPAKDKIADALGLIGERRGYHPVLDYLDRLRWDGVPRLDGWLARYTGAAETDLHRAFSRKILCAAVRRAKLPGCKFDHILVLQGGQDLGKSTLIRSLCPDPAWFTDQVKVGADAKETIERASGAWIVELAELDGLGRREANAVKSFVTTTSDKARPAYGRYTVTRPRQFALFGTTNEKAFLSDPTGNRRWWVVLAARCDIDGLIEVRDQLWAEAVQAEPNENLWLDDAILKADAARATEAVSDHGPWLELIVGKIPAEGPLKIAATDAWALVGIKSNDINKISPQQRVHLRKTMAALGFDPNPKNLRKEGIQTFAYLRGDALIANWWNPNEVSQPTSRGRDYW